MIIALAFLILLFAFYRNTDRWRKLLEKKELEWDMMHTNPQAWPTKPIKILVGVTPGGTTDTLARFLGQEMARDLGQPVVVENKPGASGNIAAEAVARSAPDGYTLVFVNTSHSVSMGLYGSRVPYDAVKDFTPVTQVSTGPAVLVAAKDFPAKDAKDVIAMAKAQPGKLDFAIGGSGPRSTWRESSSR